MQSEGSSILSVLLMEATHLFFSFSRFFRTDSVLALIGEIPDPPVAILTNRRNDLRIRIFRAESD